jgi:hypothetical protein
LQDLFANLLLPERYPEEQGHQVIEIFFKKDPDQGKIEQDGDEKIEETILGIGPVESKDLYDRRPRKIEIRVDGQNFLPKADRGRPLCVTESLGIALCARRIESLAALRTRVIESRRSESRCER